MAVETARVAATTEWELTEDEDGKFTVIVPYYVTSDDTQDGPITVMGAAGLPARNSALSAGNDSDSSLLCSGRTPHKVKDKALQWVVLCTFTAAGNEHKQDQDGNPTDDPEQWQPEIEMTTVGSSTPIRNAKFIPKPGQFIANRMNGEFGPVVNSAGQLVLPMPTRDDDRQQIRFTRYYAAVSGLQWQNISPSVNNDAFNIQKWYNGQLIFDFPILKGQLKVQGISNRFEIHTVGGVLKMYNRLSITVEIDKFGWTHKEVDRGQQARANGGDFDGKCGVVPYVAGGPDFEDNKACIGTPPLRAILGKDGLPVTEALLDGKGQPLDEGANQTQELEYEATPVLDLGWLFA